MRFIIAAWVFAFSLASLVGMVAETFRRCLTPAVRAYRVATVPFVVLGIVLNVIGMIGEELWVRLEAGERLIKKFDQPPPSSSSPEPQKGHQP